jgi:hypothetical protein
LPRLEYILTKYISRNKIGKKDDMRKNSKRNNKISLDFDGEPFTPYQLIQQVNEEGSIEIFHGIYLQTREQLVFTNEEGLKEIENTLFDDPDNEDYQSEYDEHISKNYVGASYWVTDENNKILKKIKNYKMLKSFIINYMTKNKRNNDNS